MEAASAHHHHEPMPTSGSALNGVAFSATLHCLTGCAIGEVLGMIIGTALGFSDWATVGLAVALAFLFGYGLTSLPLLRAGFSLAAVVPIALATDTFSIATMEVVDNAIMLAVPGAMGSGVDELLFWGALSVALVVAGIVAFPVNRWLIARGKGHAVVHETGVHGGPPTKVVAAVATMAAVFGTTVLVVEAASSDGDHGGGNAAEPAKEPAAAGGHGGGAAQSGGAHGGMRDAVRGLAVSEHGMKLELERTGMSRGKPTRLRFRILSTETGAAVRNFQVEHDKRLHLIVARRDMTGFQHLHPSMAPDGTWATAITLPEAGSYRVFADFKRGEANHTLAADVAVDGPVDWKTLPDPSRSATTSDGYTVESHGGRARAGRETELEFTVRRGGQPIQVEPYLGAKGHLVALREGDLAYLHVHPTADAITFATAFPSPGRYRLFLQFKHGNRVHTAAFTERVTR